ncbi:TPA: hypothetical protein QCI16_002862 [Enterobacter ludwigii]|nr:hypothetical protein [Enterobacter ludwigii]HDR2591117.1 hypothetical protein [Enterobacter ludwigii]HDR2598688.1 hypothetical protein [Enterobacter ludwigii]
MSIELTLLILVVVEIAVLFRFEWVKSMRRQVRDFFGYDDYKRLPSFRVMFLKFWVWDVNTFLTKGDSQ